MPAGGMPNEPAYMNPASLYRGGVGEINGGFIGDSQSLSGSRKSLGPLQVSCSDTTQPRLPDGKFCSAA